MIVELTLIIFGIIILLESIINKIANTDKLVVKTLNILGILSIVTAITAFVLR